MDQFQRDIEQLNTEAENASSLRMFNQIESAMTTQQSLTELFEDISEQVHGADHLLEVSVTDTDSPGMVIKFVDSHFSTPRYIVQTKVSDNQVEVSVADGLWEQLANQHGLWADWTDDKVIFRGPYSESDIRNGIEQTLLHWYKTVKLNKAKGVSMD